MRRFLSTRSAICLFAFLSWRGEALAVEESAVKKIADNLFVLEEAYNQEPGVIQHIQVLQSDPKRGEWNYSFTEEWPVPDDRNQLSITVPLTRTKETGFGIDDLWLNYRLQLVGVGGEGDLAIAPRLSVSIPTGDYRKGIGRGSTGFQLNVPASLDIGPSFTAHFNAGLTLTPNARAVDSSKATTIDTSAGVALVWLPVHWVNAFVEVAHLTEAEVVAENHTHRVQTWVVSPALRFAIDFASGLQIVPGVAAPIEMSGDDVHFTVVAYLSFEHPLWTPESKE